MKKVILILLAIAFPGLLCAKDNKSTDALLREIDGLIKNRRTYGVEKETRIADLKRLLAEATSDEQRYGFCGRLFDEYRAYNLDSSFVYGPKSSLSVQLLYYVSAWQKVHHQKSPFRLHAHFTLHDEYIH